MGQRTTLTNGLPLLVFLTQILFVVAGSGQCQVSNITVTPDEANSTFVYNIIYEDSSCSNKGKLGVTLKSCDGSKNTISYGSQYEGITVDCRRKGRWKVTAGVVNSTCFTCPHNMCNLPEMNIDYRFNFEQLKIIMKNVHPRVTDWAVTIYKTTAKWNYFICDRYNVDLMKKWFQKTRLRPNTSRTLITLNHDFEDACYCFLMEPISNMDLRSCIAYLPDNGSCTPSSNDFPRPLSVQTPMSPRTRVLLVMLVGIVIFVVIVLKVMFDRLPGLKQLLGKKRPSKQSRRNDVLLLYAPDISGSEDLAKLKNQLRHDFKVHDLFDWEDVKRLADPCGWVQDKFKPGSGVKFLLVESVGLMDLINSLLQPCSENPCIVKAAQPSCKLLTLSLRNIICTDLQYDYSAVFVVRLSDDVKNVSNLVVPRARYKFPDHFPKLQEALREARWNSDGYEVL